MKKMFTLVGFLCLFVFSPGKSASTNLMRNETDHLSLLEFKKEITDDPLQVLSSWNVSLHFCQWQGVTCGRKHQRVTALELHGFGLVGHLSTHLSNLSFLRVLDLGGNHIHGELPQEFGHLFRLRILQLQNNSLGGEIPSNLSHCLQLENVDLSRNKLVETIPSELGSLSKVRYLLLNNNNLSGLIPPTLGNLTSLEFLYLRYNNFEGLIPHQIGQLVQLEGLYFGVNNFTGEIPLSLYNLSQIRDFELANNNLYGRLPLNFGVVFPNLSRVSIGANQFTGPIPASFANASHLTVLDFALNNFLGPMPFDIGKLQNLTTLYIGGNKLGSTESSDNEDNLLFITSLTNCSRLKFFNAISTGFHGLLPPAIANLSSSLVDLELGQNSLYGSIPSEIGNLINLQVLSLEFNSLIGPIPPGIGKLRELEGITLGENGLSGPIPTSIGNLTQLVQLDLSANQLQGIIPPSLANCERLNDLRLFKNLLRGNIPTSLFKLSSLVYLFLSYNSLSGSLAVEVGNLININMLLLSKNQLSGEIPDSLGRCISLETVHMNDNFFHGTIPMSLGELKVIKQLDLSHNNLSGSIPEFLSKLTYLEDLNLSFNNFVGEVPKEGVFKNTSLFWLEGNSKLCGGIWELHLPPCPNNNVGKHKRTFSIKHLVLSVIGGLILALILLALLWTRLTKRKSAQLHYMDHLQMKVSYQELFAATDGFSTDNLVGRGRFGSVYKGTLDRHQTTVAVKVLKLEETGAMKSFTAECEALRNIRHRNLVKLHTYCSGFDSEGKEFGALVFDFMPNGTLGSWLHPQNEPVSTRCLNLKQRLDIAIDVADALVYLHEHCHCPIVHCDLKPDNVLLDDDMVAHVSDFGLAKILFPGNVVSTRLQSSTNKIKGTIGYIPPEYGIRGKVTTQGDVFSYGVLLLEMFTGKKPTDDMFKDGLTISKYVKIAFPERIMQIKDPHLVQEEEVHGSEKIRYCLLSIVRTGIRCTSEIPGDRITMGDVKTELDLAKKAFEEEIEMEELHVSEESHGRC